MIGAVIIGIITGYLARLLLPGKQSLGFVATAIVGIAGAALGYLVFTVLLGIGDEAAFDLGSLPGAVVGAIALLLAYERLRGRGRPTAPTRVR
ncbi:MAG: GlsB/YeaQ/YmgE family stress response membrane protein [Solirubrobacterales bacterium]